jgi:hypothetical protein
MRQLLNTLYVMTEGSYVHLDHETLKVEMDGTTKLQVPLHHLGGVVCFGNVMVSPFLLHVAPDHSVGRGLKQLWPLGCRGLGTVAPDHSVGRGLKRPARATLASTPMT